jgi:hypothetical protein
VRSRSRPRPQGLRSGSQTLESTASSNPFFLATAPTARRGDVVATQGGGNPAAVVLPGPVSAPVSLPVSGQRLSRRFDGVRRQLDRLDRVLFSPNLPSPSLRATAPGRPAAMSSEAHQLTLSNERQELICSVIGLVVKVGIVAVAGTSLCRLAGAYQQRMERQGELSAVLELESAKLAKARDRFDHLFMVEGEQRLIREQSQWIAPNRLRIVWRSNKPFPTVETAAAVGSSGTSRP